ncbi:hypothetical protein LTR12_005720 [Friedmanniomyces endolithicus]|nr:hypothetical protein LTR12_005720 [Friedmanniomyces endolithicus]
MAAQRYQPWALQQGLSNPRRAGQSTLLALQRYTEPLVCHLVCGELELCTPEDKAFCVFFSVVPDPQCARFEIVLCIIPAPDQRDTTHTYRERYAEERMSARFLAQDDFGPVFTRRPFDFQARPAKNDPPTGCHNFSRQLYAVQSRPLEEAEVAVGRLPRFDVPKGQVVFSWKGTAFSKLAINRPATGIAAAAARTFRAILQAMESGGELHVVSVPHKNGGGIRVLDTYWPYFASLPSPSPPQYWAWIKQRSDFAQLDTILNFCGDRFELDSNYVDKALSVRQASWYDAKKASWENVNTIPEPLVIASMPKVTRFLNERQYIFYTLGSHTYEHLHSRTQLYKAFSGTYRCELVADAACAPDEYDVLLNIHLERTAEISAALDSAEHLLPEVGEPVSMTVTFDARIGLEVLLGEVVPVPASAIGGNVMARVKRSQQAGGRVPHEHVVRADFRFGHEGISETSVQRGILELMLDFIPGATAAFFKEYLLAQDIHGLTGNVSEVGLPSTCRVTAGAACTQASLNREQREIVFRFFSQFITIVVGPPGSGKDALVGVILGLLEGFAQKYWVCANSNAAVDILADGACKRMGQDQPEGYLRLKSASQEGYAPPQRHLQRLLLRWPGAPFGEVGPRASTRKMQLEQTISRRMVLFRLHQLGRGAWRTEEESLAALAAAADELVSPRLEGSNASTDELQGLEKAAQESFCVALRKLQRIYRMQ